MKGKRVTVKRSACNSVLIKMSSEVADTPRIPGNGMVGKSSWKGKIIKILPNSGAMMTLCRTRITRRLGLKEGEQFELYDA